LPEQDAVIVTTAYTRDMQAMLDAMWTHLLPGLTTASPSPASPGTVAAQGRLSARLGRLELPACPGAPAPADSGGWPGPFTIPASTADAHPVPMPANTVRPFLTSIEVAPAADGWQVSLIEPANALSFPFGIGSWMVSDHADRHGETIPVAASGGWLDAQTLRVEVIFLETPHRMDITCTLPTRAAEAVWRHPPITASKLQHLHCPS